MRYRADLSSSLKREQEEEEQEIVKQKQKREKRGQKLVWRRRNVSSNCCIQEKRKTETEAGNWRLRFKNRRLELDGFEDKTVCAVTAQYT